MLPCKKADGYQETTVGRWEIKERANPNRFFGPHRVQWVSAAFPTFTLTAAITAIDRVGVAQGRSERFDLFADIGAKLLGVFQEFLPIRLQLIFDRLFVRFRSPGEFREETFLDIRLGFPVGIVLVDQLLKGLRDGGIFRHPESGQKCSATMAVVMFADRGSGGHGFIRWARDDRETAGERRPHQGT